MTASDGILSRSAVAIFLSCCIAIRYLILAIVFTECNTSLYTYGVLRYYSYVFNQLQFFWSYFFDPCKIVFLHFPIVLYQHLFLVYIEVCYLIIFFLFDPWPFCTLLRYSFICLSNFFWCQQCSLMLHLFQMLFATSPLAEGQTDEYDLFTSF